MLFGKKNKKKEIVSTETIPITEKEKSLIDFYELESSELSVSFENANQKASLDQQIFNVKTKQEKPYLSEISPPSIVDSPINSSNSHSISITKESKEIPSPTTLPPKKTRKKLNRNKEIKARFTDNEIKIIEKKIKKSGLRKGEFVRKSLLTQDIKERNNTTEQIESVMALIELKSELGKVGGLLKAFIKPNSYNPNVSLQDIENIKKQLNELEKLKREIEKEVKKTWQY